MSVVFERTKLLTDKQFHYCPGCNHGIIHRLVAESLDELVQEGKLEAGMFAEQLTEPNNLDAMWNTLKIALLTTILGTIMGVFYAWLLGRSDIPAKGLMRALFNIPYMFPPFLGAMAWDMMFNGRSGYINKWLALVTGDDIFTPDDRKTIEKSLLFYNYGWNTSDGLWHHSGRTYAYSSQIYADYNPSEAQKLRAAFLEQNGRYVVYCAAPDPGAAKDAYLAFFKGE